MRNFYILATTDKRKKNMYHDFIFIFDLAQIFTLKITKLNKTEKICFGGEKKILLI